MLQSPGISMYHYSHDKMDTSTLLQDPFPLEFIVLSWTNHTHVRQIFSIDSNHELTLAYNQENSHRSKQLPYIYIKWFRPMIFEEKKAKKTNHCDKKLD